MLLVVLRFHICFFFILPAVMTRVLTKWLSVFWWDCRRSWKVLRRERCSAWEGRWTSSYSRPWTPKIWADSFLGGNPGCDLEGSSAFLEETYFYAASVLTFQTGISQLKHVRSNREGLYMLVFGGWLGFFFNNLFTEKTFCVHWCSLYSIKHQPMLWCSLWPAGPSPGRTGCAVFFKPEIHHFCVHVK